MNSSIYISQEKIQAIGHAAGEVKRYASCPLPEGTMINGMITDRSALVEALAQLRAKHPALFTSPSLVVDGSSVLVKRIAAPKLKRSRYDQLVRDDFAEGGENAADLACGYQVLDRSVLACAANKTLVDSYIAAFRDVGVKLRDIHIGTQAILHYISSQRALLKRTFVLNVVDGVTMLSIIFDNGANVFMQRTRLYGEDRTQLAQTMVENLSRLAQFNRSQKLGDITDSVYFGIGGEDLKLMEAFNPLADIKLQRPDVFGGVRGAEELPPEAHFAYFNTLLGKDSIDLIRSRRELDKVNRRRKTKRLWIPALAVYTVLLTIPAIYLYIQVRNIDKDIAGADAYLNDPAAVERLAEATRYEAMAGQYSGVVSERDGKLEWETGKPPISGSLVDTVLFGYDRVVIGQFDYNEKSGILRVSGTGVSDADPSAYIDMLKASELVASVRYSGYDAGFRFNADITLTPAALLGEG